MSNEIQAVEEPKALAVNGELEMSEWSMMKEQAAVLIKTGFIPAALNTPEKVIAVMLTARELHIGRMEALRSINIIQGKPCMSAQLMLALAQRTREVENIQIAEDDDGAHVTIQRKSQKPYTAHFGPAQAKSLGLIDKDNYKKQAATMYKWRALAEALRFTFPDAVCGIYTPEEMGAPVVVNSDGELVVDAEALKPVSKPTGAEKKINADQQKLLFSKIDKSGIDREEVKLYLKTEFKKEHTKDLTVEELSKVIKWLEQEPVS